MAEWHQKVSPLLERAILFSDEQPPDLSRVEKLMRAIQRHLREPATSDPGSFDAIDLHLATEQILRLLPHNSNREISRQLKATWMAVILDEPWLDIV